MPLPTNISADTRRLNPQLFGTTEGIQRMIADAAAGKKRIRQHQGDGMNKWEREYRDHLLKHWAYVHREVSLPLANGLRYKVDFLVFRFGSVEGHEVKGFARSTGIAKIKMAASVYPWIKFRLVTKMKLRDGGTWDVQEILP